MRVNVTFYIYINENSNSEEIKQAILGAFKQNFDIISKGKKIKPDQEFNKINASTDPKLFLLFSKYKTNKADSIISAPKVVKSSIPQAEKTESSNPANSYISPFMIIEKSATSKEEDHQESEKIEADQNYNKSPSEIASSEGNQELKIAEIEKGDLNQSRDPLFPGSDLTIKQVADNWFSMMASDEANIATILQIGKDPNYYDEFAKQVLLQNPDSEFFFKICKSDIIKLCQEWIVKS
ncbi:unnamed protein product [Blepharisma stoltei]|uniref:Uncharacterized protein n=1 Tax=Blepharisma stoltei TaxID=1481888 RepID=A0AAU9KE25_9CILI|nr:unnamed protein product [Blepharisma stoltei]